MVAVTSVDRPRRPAASISTCRRSGERTSISVSTDRLIRSSTVPNRRRYWEPALAANVPRPGMRFTSPSATSSW